MFHPLRLEVMNRFTAVRIHFRAQRKMDGVAAQAARGLVFVQIYAVYEYTVVTMMQVAIDAIVSHQRSFSDLRPSLLALFLDPMLDSLRKVGPNKVWDTRMAMMTQACSTDPVVVPNGVLPVNGTHFRYEQLQLIFKVLGIKRRPARKWQHLHRINEIVEHRNHIAHGLETAENVGRRYTRGDIYHRIRQTESVCFHLLAVVEEHCLDAKNVCRKETTVGYSIVSPPGSAPPRASSHLSNPEASPTQPPPGSSSRPASQATA